MPQPRLALMKGQCSISNRNTNTAGRAQNCDRRPGRADAPSRPGRPNVKAGPSRADGLKRPLSELRRAKAEARNQTDAYPPRGAVAQPRPSAIVWTRKAGSIGSMAAFMVREAASDFVLASVAAEDMHVRARASALAVSLVEPMHPVFAAVRSQAMRDRMIDLAMSAAALPLAATTRPGTKPNAPQTSM